MAVALVTVEKQGVYTYREPELPSVVPSSLAIYTVELIFTCQCMTSRQRLDVAAGPNAPWPEWLTQNTCLDSYFHVQVHRLKGYSRIIGLLEVVCVPGLSSLLGRCKSPRSWQVPRVRPAAPSTWAPSFHDSLIHVILQRAVYFLKRNILLPSTDQREGNTRVAEHVHVDLVAVAR